MSLRPSEIRFTQDSISEEFGDAYYARHTIEGTFRQLLYGEISIGSLPNITVARDGQSRIWVVYGNRRLYVYKKLEEYGRISGVNVDFTMYNSSQIRSTTNDGRSVFIRQDKNHQYGDRMDDRIRRIYDNWTGRSIYGQSRYEGGSAGYHANEQPEMKCSKCLVFTIIFIMLVGALLIALAQK